jgi:transcriptional regulator of acetoin/glycerol metabolism
MNYHWPGNVRELEHALEHAFVLCRGDRIEIEHMPWEIREYSSLQSPPQELPTSDEAETIRRVLQQTDGNKAKTARLLGMSRRTLYRKIKKYDFTESDDL